MNKREKVTYAATITALVVTLSVLWFLIVNTVNSNYATNDDGISAMHSRNDSSSVSYLAVKEITSDENITSGEFSSTNADENVISASGNITATLSGITVNKTGDSNDGDNTSFYGTNSAIIAKNGANLNIKNANIATDATGANGVFSYGGSATTSNSSSDGTTVSISDSTITTNKDNSGGIMTTGGGIMNAKNLTITTAGTSSAAIRSDRGGGTINNENAGEVELTLDSSSSITLTGDAYIKSLVNADAINSNIHTNGYKLYVNGTLLE